MKPNVLHGWFFFLFFFLAACTNDQHKDPASDSSEMPSDEQSITEAAATEVLSPRTSSLATFGGNQVHVDFGAPRMRGRKIFGELVPYDQIWVSGAHQATSISFSKDTRVGGAVLPAGTYAFFSIPGKKEWTLIFNKNYEQHQADDYDPALDVVRLKVEPQKPSKAVEALTYKVRPQSDQKASILLMWEKTQVVFDVENVN